MLLAGGGGAARAEELTFSATVDKTTVAVRRPIQLTVTLSGDTSGVALPALEFPEGFVMASRSQATNISIRRGQAQRSLSATYVLLPQAAGTYELGPFTVEHKGQTVSTEPIEITVEKPALPPDLGPPAELFTL